MLIMADTITPPEKKPSGSVAWLVATLAAAALLIANVEALNNAWCKYIGLFCTFKIESVPVSASSGGSPGPFAKDEQCRPHFVPVTIAPTTRYRILDDESVKFEATNTKATSYCKPPTFL